jgi:chromosome segregation protein
LKEELERDTNQHKHVQYNIKRLNEEKMQEDENLQTITARVAELKAAVDDLRISQTETRAELNELNSVNNRLQNQVYKTEKDIDILNIQQQALEQESLRNMEDASNKEVELSHFNRVVAELDGRTETLKSEYELAVDAENKLQEQIITTEGELKTVTENIAADSRKLDAKQNEYNLTKSMVDNLEGFPESIRFLKKNTNWAKNITLFSDILFCKEEYRIAIENYLEPLMNHYVVNNYDEAIAAINLLSNSSKGRAQFFILDNYSADTAVANVNLSGVSIPALSVIEVEPRYAPLCTHLLKNIYLVNDHTEQDINNLSLPDGVVLIGKSGKFNKSRHTMAGGSVGLFEGKRIGRAKNLDNLLKEIKQAETRIGSFKNQSQELQSTLAALKASGKANEIRQKQADLNKLNTELVTVKTKQEQYQAFIENSLNRKQDIANKIAGIKLEIQTLQPALVEYREQKQAQAELMLDKQQAFNELNEFLSVQSNAYNQENIRFHQQQNKVSGLLKDLEYRESQLDNLDGRIMHNSAEMEKVKALIKENLQQTGDSDEDLLGMYEQKENLEKATQEAEREYYTWRGSITESENEILVLRRNKDQAELIENELKDARNNLKLELNALKERLSVEFNVDIADLPETEENQTESEADIRERTDKLKRQMDDFGAINPMAVEAYNEMSERHSFIQAQKKDLAEAKASLLATIQEIDDTAKEKFMSAFTLVRENFIKVFRSLFNEEDSCDLILSDPSHPLESEIDIIARPKGKRPLSINQLSGGEKTLTATAILFSLYLLKPAPFCIFDEVDAPLDDTNIDKFNNIIRKFSKESQFIIISHNKRTIACTDIIYGVTMVEQGISRVVPVDLRELAD